MFAYPKFDTEYPDFKLGSQIEHFLNSQSSGKRTCYLSSDKTVQRFVGACSAQTIESLYLVYHHEITEFLRFESYPLMSFSQFRFSQVQDDTLAISAGLHGIL